MADEEPRRGRLDAIGRALGQIQTAISLQRNRPAARGEPQSTVEMPNGEELEVEWDPNKADEVWHEHHVSFDEAATVFADPLALTVFDGDHSFDEDRWVTIGLTRQDKVVVVSHTPRGARVRLITARWPEPEERKHYEQDEGQGDR